MFCIPKIDDYSKILTDDEVKDFAVTTFGEYFKSANEKLYSKLNKEQTLRKIAELPYMNCLMKLKNMLRWCNQVILIMLYVIIQILNLFDPGLQLINTKPIIKFKNYVKWVEKV